MIYPVGIKIKDSDGVKIIAPKKLNITGGMSVHRLKTKAIITPALMELNTAGLMRLSCDAEDVEAPIVTGDNDPRMTDDRYPTAHHISHEAGGNDEIENQTESSVTDLVIDLADRVQGNGFFGDASDGDVTLTEDTTLDRDMFYDNLIVPEGITLYPNGFRFSVQDTLTNNGVIDISGVDGYDGSDSDGGSGAAGGDGGDATNDGYLPLGIAGVDGGNGRGGGYPTGYNGKNGTAITNAVIASVIDSVYGGRGGEKTRGDHEPYNGGTPGLGTIPTLVSAGCSKGTDFFDGALGRVFNVNTCIRFNINGSNGSPGGGGTGSNSYGWQNKLGGGGGGGGNGGNAGMLTIFAKKIIGSGTIIAKGGKGGDGGDGGVAPTNSYPDIFCIYGGSCGSGGGGGGGGATGGNGGYIYIVSYDMSGFTGSVDVSGGDGGNGGDGGDGGYETWVSSILEVPRGGNGGHGVSTPIVGGAKYGNGGNGGSAGIIIIYTNQNTSFTYNINYGNGGNGGQGGDGGKGVGASAVYKGVNGNGGNGGNGGSGFIGGNGGQGGVSPEATEESIKGDDGEAGVSGTSHGLTGTYILATI